MTDKSQQHNVKCPYCGHVHVIIVDGDSGDLFVRGLNDVVKKALDRAKKIQSDKALREANAWWDITCPNCKKEFRYNVFTGEVML